MSMSMRLLLPAHLPRREVLIMVASPHPTYPLGQLCTISYSSHDQHSFLTTLRTNGVGLLVDIRYSGAAGRYPAFSYRALRDFLPSRGVDFIRIANLGNVNYRSRTAPIKLLDADAGLDELESWMRRYDRTAIMCVCRALTSCHRRVVACLMTARHPDLVVLNLAAP